MAYILTDDVIKELKDIAKYLPIAQYTAHETVTMKGHELKLSGYDEMEEYKGKFEDDKEYAVPMPAYYQVNHFRRMRKAYQRNGVGGVKKYCQPYFDQAQKQRHASKNY